MSRVLTIVVLALGLVWSQPLSDAEGPGEAQVQDLARKRSVDRGIDWLLRNQNPDKGWGCVEPRTPSSTGLTGLVVLCLMGSGHTPTRGRHSKQIREGVDFILRHAKPGGELLGPYFTDMGQLYDHCNAMMALAMVHGTHPRRNKEIHRTLQKATKYLIETQNPTGGWSRHGSGDDPSVTGFAWLALRSAHSAGIVIRNDHGKIEKYFKNNIPRRGGRLAGGSNIAQVAGWLRIATGIGRELDPEVKKWADDLSKRFLITDIPGRISEWDFLASILLAQAFRVTGGQHYSRWYPAACRYYMRLQNKRDGSWTILYCMSCKTLATTLTVMFLQTADRMIPLHDL